MALRVTLVCPEDEAYNLGDPDAHATVIEALEAATGQRVDLTVRARPNTPRPVMVMTDDLEVD